MAEQLHPTMVEPIIEPLPSTQTQEAVSPRQLSIEDAVSLAGADLAYAQHDLKAQIAEHDLNDTVNEDVQVLSTARRVLDRVREGGNESSLPRAIEAYRATLEKQGQLSGSKDAQILAKGIGLASVLAGRNQAGYATVFDAHNRFSQARGWKGNTEVARAEMFRRHGDEPEQSAGKHGEEQRPNAESRELLQAQMALFAESLGYDDRQQLFQNLGELSLSLLVDIAYTDPRQPETERVISSQAFIDHLREVGGSKSEIIRARTEALRAYKEFGPEVTDWLRKINAERKHPDFVSHKDHPAFLGEGAEAAAFELTHDGKEYVAKFSTSPSTAESDVDDALLDLSAGRGEPHLEQLVAVSYEDGVAVVERMPGKEFSKLGVSDWSEVSEEQMAEALSTMHRAAQRGVILDKEPSNYFYDAKEGFGFIDYVSKGSSRIGEDAVVPSDSEMATDFIDALVGQSQDDETEVATNDQPESPQIIQARLALLQNYHGVCERTMASQKVDYTSTIHRIDELLVQNQQALVAVA